MFQLLRHRDSISALKTLLDYFYTELLSTKVDTISSIKHIMGGAGIIVLVLVSALAFAGQASAYPSDLTKTLPSFTSSPITATTLVSAMEEVKETKEIKDAVTASKSLKDTIKAGKEARKNRKDCLKKGCIEYDPICIHDPNDPMFKPRTIGSPCALEVLNCEMGTKLAMKSKGDCPGSGGVKLS